MNILNESTKVTSNSTTDSVNLLLQLSLWSVRIVCPLILVIAPVCNWACIQIFRSRIYARSSSKWYFIFIAIFDTIYVLVTAPLVFLVTFEIYILNWNVLLCKSVLFFNYLSCQISAGLLACLSIDRLIATSYVSLYRQNCTTNLSRIVCLVVIGVFSILNCHYLIGYNIDGGGYCNIRRYKWYEDSYSFLNVVYLLSYSIIPFTIITICNFLIVLSVCQNKTNLKRKYENKKPTNISREPSITPKTSSHNFEKYTKPIKTEQHSSNRKLNEENQYEMFVALQNSKAINGLVDSNSDIQAPQTNRLSEKLLLSNDVPRSSLEISPSLFTEHKQLALPSKRERSLSVTFVSSSSPAHSQKMGIQLQITISLLAISICFIFCTLPNCISTIMIQNHTNDEHVRKFWQAMNYFSIVPLLITHSVNLIFYYLSSNMFRERFNEYYLKKKP